MAIIAEEEVVAMEAKIKKMAVMETVEAEEVFSMTDSIISS